jgi:CRP-like cAMP-binding protein
MPHKRVPIVPSQVKNRILSSLPEDEYQRILPHLAYVGLSQGRILYSDDNLIDFAYFMNSGMTSMVAVNENGEILESGIVGNEGLMGIQAALGEDGMFYRGVVQIPGNAMRIRAETLKHQFQANTGLSRLLLDYMLALRLQVSRFAICNRAHSLEQRLCRWLLTSQDCARSERLPVTHEFLSHMMGASRPSVRLTSATLQYIGLISYRRDHFRIMDRQGVEARACECYRIIEDKYNRLSAA